MPIKYSFTCLLNFDFWLYLFKDKCGKLFLKLFQSFMQLYLTDWVPQICVLTEGISRRHFANLCFFSIWDIKRQLRRYRRSGSFMIFNSLYNWLIESYCFLNKFFLKALFGSFYILFWLVIYDWSHSWDPYSRWEQKREWYL